MGKAIGRVSNSGGFAGGGRKSKKRWSYQAISVAASCLLLLTVVYTTQWATSEVLLRTLDGEDLSTATLRRKAVSKQSRTHYTMTCARKKIKEGESEDKEGGGAGGGGGGKGEEKFENVTLILPVLPQLILAGVQKAGTTAMYSLMKDHPDIYTTRRPEPHFFDMDHYQWMSTSNCEKEIKYASKFVNISQPKEWRYRGRGGAGDAGDVEGKNNETTAGHDNNDGGDAAVYFEKTPSYFQIPGVPRRIKEFCGILNRRKRCDPKILLMLRNPIDRALSQFRFEKVAYGDNTTTKETFEEQVKLSVRKLIEAGVLNTSASSTTTDESSLDSFEHNNDLSLSESLDRLKRYGGDMIIKGFYDVHLYNWLREFPRDKIMVISYEDFRSNKKMEVFDNVLQFVGLPPLPPPPAEGTDLAKLTPRQRQLHKLRENTLADKDNLFDKYFKKFSPSNTEEAQQRQGDVVVGGDEEQGGRSTTTTTTTTVSDETTRYLQKLYEPHVERLADVIGEEWRNKWW